MKNRSTMNYNRLSVTIVVCLLVAIGFTSSAMGQATSITSTGFGANEKGNGTLNLGWTTGNLGNTWSEGEWVAYQLRIENVQTDYPGLVGLPDIVMEYDFTAQNDARFVDLVRSIQVGTVQLNDSQGWPTPGGMAYPMTTRSELEEAQNSATENGWSNFTLLNLPNSQVNRGAAPGFGDGSPSDQFRYFYITKQDLLDANLPTSADTIIIYYQLHESRSFVWFNSLQEQYDAPPTDDWGGSVYSLAPFASDSRQGSGYVPGSSGQLRVSFAGGDKTVPIPIPERLPGAVSGLKWRDQDGDGVIDPEEQFLDGWRIYVSGTLENIFFQTSTLTSGGGLYSFPNLTSNVVWSIYEDASYEMTGEDNFMQTYPMVGTTLGVGTGVPHANSQYGAVAWDVALTEINSDQPDMNFGNKQCEVAIVCPPNITIDCNDPQGPDNTGYPSVESNCPPAVPEYSDVIFDGDCDTDGYLYYIERSWVVFDAAGQSDTCVQIIYVNDTTAPVITGVGPDDTIECPAAPQFSTPNASDDCSDPTLTYNDVTTPGSCPQEYSVTRTWTATDDCGNSSQDSQTITVVDNTPPVITGVGADDTIECPAEPQFSTPSASDACGPATLTYADVTTPGSCPQEYSVTRTWTATDDCGNSSQDSQTINVVDNTAPVITCPSNVDANCEDAVVFGVATAVDGCDPDPAIDFSDDTLSTTCPLEIARTWTATDDCGNSSSCIQSIIIRDETPPTITGVGNNMTIDCPGTPVFSSPTASDNCGEPTLTFADVTTPGSCPQEYSVTRTWTATDGCLNTASASQTITVVDDTPPVITGVGEDATIDCPDEPQFSTPSAEDACGQATLTFEDVTTPGACPAEYSVTRTWTAVDDCGNSSTDSQTISVQDITGPSIQCAAGETIACDEEPVFTPPTAIDACDLDPEIIMVSTDTTAGPGDATTFTRSWYAVDDCGNASDTCSQSIVRESCPEGCTFTIGGWGSGCPDSQADDMYSTQPGCIRDHYFDYVFPGGEVVIGHPSGYTARWTSASAVEAFLPSGGTPHTLTADLVNPTSTPAGVLASQVLGLTLNVEYSCAGVFGDLGIAPSGFCYSNAIIESDCGGPFAGMTVGEFLVIANKVVAGKTSVLNGYGATISDVNFTATCLNELHDECDPFAHYVIVGSFAPKEPSNNDHVLFKEGSQILPRDFALDQNTPNPFNPVTDISFSLPFTAHVTLDIYNIMGQRVITLVDRSMEAGYHSVTWNASNQASGMYFYRLQAGSFAETKKMLLLK